MPEIPTNSDSPQMGDSRPPPCSLLEWKPDPDRRIILGSSRLAPGITLYIIELMEGRDDRGNMSGAFIPDDLEKGGLYRAALVQWLKWNAESMMVEFLAKQSPALLARMDSSVAASREWGDALVSKGKPQEADPYFWMAAGVAELRDEFIGANAEVSHDV